MQEHRSQQTPGPFDQILQTVPPERHDRSALFIIAVIAVLGIVLLILVLPPVSMLSGSGNGREPAPADRISTAPRDTLPGLPDGMEAVSRLYDVSAPPNLKGGFTITIKLTKRLPAGAAVPFYTYDGGWKRLADGAVSQDGMAATVDLPRLPGSVAVLRRTERVRTAFATLPAANEIDPRVGGAIDTIQPMDYILSPDGRVLGETTALPADTPYRVIPVITNIDPDAIVALLQSPESQAAHINAIMELAQRFGFAGVDLNYRQVDPAYRDTFSAFAATLAGRLHADGRTFVLSIPMPIVTGAEAETFGYDWEALGREADFIKIVPPDDQSAYRSQATAALEYVVRRVDRKKLLLGLSNIAYEKGAEGIRTMPVADALALAATVELRPSARVAPDALVTLVGANLARDAGATGLYWDDDALSVTFAYPGDSGKRTVWVFNAFSAAFRIDLARRYGLGGVWIDNAGAGSHGADIWAEVQQYIDTGSVVLAKPNPAMLAPEWRATAGSLDANTGDAVSWRAPAEPGTYDITLVVGDGVVRVGRSFPVDVERTRGAGGSPAPSGEP
jgi:hypothetical protein